MSIFRPEGTESNVSSSNFYGICEIAIIDFEDKSSSWDWADIYINVEVKQKGSDYTKQLRIAGSLDRDANGKVSGGSVLKRVYHFFDVIGETAGMNIDGGWEDDSGKAIKNIASYLSDRHSAPFIPDGDVSDFDYLAYVYKEKPKQKGGKVYSRVFHRIYPNNATGKTKLESDVKWFKEKGFIKEANDSDISTPEKSVHLSSSGLGNL